MAQVIMLIPTPLRKFSGGLEQLPVQAANVEDALNNLNLKYEALVNCLISPDGQIRNFVNIYIGENNIRVLDGLETALAEGDTVNIVTAVVGG
jgi:molybdopterin converting factor small subunit